MLSITNKKKPPPPSHRDKKDKEKGKKVSHFTVLAEGRKEDMGVKAMQTTAKKRVRLYYFCLCIHAAFLLYSFAHFLTLYWRQSLFYVSEFVERVWF